jgi:hypothetical protein
MKSIAIDGANGELTDILQRPDEHEPIILTEGPDAVALLLKLPKGTPKSTVDAIALHDGPFGGVYLIIQSKEHSETQRLATDVQPKRGSCHGMLSLPSDDDEHLKYFDEYMQ